MEPDPRLLKAIRAADNERARRIAAERKINVLAACIARMKKLHTADAKAQQAEQRAR